MGKGRKEEMGEGSKKWAKEGKKEDPKGQERQSEVLKK